MVIGEKIASIIVYATIFGLGYGKGKACGPSPFPILYGDGILDIIGLVA